MIWKRTRLRRWRGTLFRSLSGALGLTLLELPHLAPLASTGEIPPASGRDDACDEELTARGVSFMPLRDLGFVRTPIEVTGGIGDLRLVPRGRKRAVMDCSLALALHDAAPVFVSLGLTELTFSAAHDHRTRRGSAQLSSHALGTAIDVHSFTGLAGDHDVLAHFEKGVGRWQNLQPSEGALEACIGQPLTPPGRTLRTLACRLKLETAFRILVTPDDNADHRDHLHIEYAPLGRAAAAPEAREGTAPRVAPARSEEVQPASPRAARVRRKRLAQKRAKAPAASRAKARSAGRKAATPPPKTTRRPAAKGNRVAAPKALKR